MSRATQVWQHSADFPRERAPVFSIQQRGKINSHKDCLTQTQDMFRSWSTVKACTVSVDRIKPAYILFDSDCTKLTTSTSNGTRLDPTPDQSHSGAAHSTPANRRGLVGIFASLPAFSKQAVGGGVK
ncbi:hypothetical protein ACJJTC_003051 [Scirpophaga incertulas]